VVILLDSITRLARATTPSFRPQASALRRRGFERIAASEALLLVRLANIEEGGSLTIIATALIDTGSRMDDVSLKNSKAPATRKSSWSASWWISVCSRRLTFSARAREKKELLIPKEDLQRIWVLRKVLNPLSPVEAMELLIDKLSKTRANSEFLSNMSSL